MPAEDLESLEDEGATTGGHRDEPKAAENDESLA